MTGKRSFDFVIVGGGSAGCVLAARLSENPDVSVVLLEAWKPDTHLWLKLPLKFRDLMTDRRFDAADAQDDEAIDAYIRNTVSMLLHPTSTCRMGSDPGAVVDPELRVRGVEALRVVDASIMPAVVGGHTNAPTIMIAERAADMILGGQPLPPADIFAAAAQR